MSPTAMSPWERWCVHLGTLLVGGTGVVYAVMLYFLEPVDPYSVVNHPWQPMIQHLHVWTAPLLVFGAGLIWRQHIWKHWKQSVQARRRSGLSLLLTLAPMVVSGYLIQTSVDATWRNVWVGVHVTASLLWLLGYAGHFVPAVVRHRRRSQASRTPARSSARNPADGTRTTDGPALGETG